MTTIPSSVRLTNRIEERKNRIISAPFTDGLYRSLDRLYKNVFCSAPRAAVLHDTGSVWAFVIEINDVTEQIILFTRKGNELIVLNELVTLPQEDVRQFAEHIFVRYHGIDLISFPSIRTEPINTIYPVQRHNATEDIVAHLPGTAGAYLSRLSKNTRESIRRYQKRITKNHPEIEFHFYERDDAPIAELLQVIDLSKARIRQKRQVPTHTDQTIAHLLGMVSKYGVTLTATRDGKVCGGVICTRIHEHFYMHVIAHDPLLDNLRLGKICCYMSICDAIERGCKEYHMLSGEYDYKYQLLGDLKIYQKITLYRSRLSILLNLKISLNNEIRGKGRRVKQTLRRWMKRWSR